VTYIRDFHYAGEKSKERKLNSVISGIMAKGMKALKMDTKVTSNLSGLSVIEIEKL